MGHILPSIFFRFLCLNGALMPDPASVETIRAAVGVFAPPIDGRPGALDLGVDRHVVELMEQGLEGAVDLVATLLDAYAAGVNPERPFARMTADERTQVLRTMCEDEAPDIREAVDTILIFTMGGMYSEWTGYDRATKTLKRPAQWDWIGHPGPALGHPVYRKDV